MTRHAAAVRPVLRPWPLGLRCRSGPTLCAIYAVSLAGKSTVGSHPLECSHAIEDYDSEQRG